MNDALDRAILSCRIPPLENDKYLVAFLDEVALQLYQLDLKLIEGVVVSLLRNLVNRLIGFLSFFLLMAIFFIQEIRGCFLELLFVGLDPFGF